jgi:hypothetical protein
LSFLLAGHYKTLWFFFLWTEGKKFSYLLLLLLDSPKSDSLSSLSLFLRAKLRLPEDEKDGFFKTREPIAVGVDWPIGDPFGENLC